MSIIQKIKNFFFTRKKIKEKTTHIKKLPPSPIGLKGHYNEITSIDISKSNIRHMKDFDITTENLRWIKFPDKYCGNPDKCIIVFNKKSFVTTLYLKWLLQKHLQVYKSSNEFWENVIIYGSINKNNFKNIINNYYLYNSDKNSTYFLYFMIVKGYRIFINYTNKLF